MSRTLTKAQAHAVVTFSGEALTVWRPPSSRMLALAVAVGTVAVIWAAAVWCW